MSSGFDDDNFDWTGRDQGGGSQSAVADALDFVIPSSVSGVDVQEIEDEQSRRDQEWKEKRFATAPVGRHLFRVAGFLKPPALITKTGYVNGQKADYEAYAVTVKFEIVGKPNLTIIDYMELPPRAEKSSIYHSFMKKSDGKVPGWFARKFEQFAKNLGYSIVQGQPYPADVLSIKNWIGKQVYATVIPPDKDDTRVRKVDPATGEEEPLNNQFKAFSYQMAESTVVGQPTGQAKSATGPATRPAQPAREPVGAGADRFVKAGLGNI